MKKRGNVTSKRKKKMEINENKLVGIKIVDQREDKQVNQEKCKVV